MNFSLQQIIGNICVGLACIVFLFPLRHLMWDYARRNLNSDAWTRPVLFVLIPLWLLLIGALLCVTASGGFDWLQLGRPVLYVLTVGATIALAVVSFVFIALYIRPGFTPRGLYIPVIYLVHFATVLLVLLSLNPRLALGNSLQWLRWPWAVFAALSLVGCVGFVGVWMVRSGVGGVMRLAYRIGNPGPSSDSILAKLLVLDPQRDFAELLSRAGSGYSRPVREAATSRLRANPQFLKALAAVLNSRNPDDGLSFLVSATLSPDECARLALPARAALQCFIHEIPAPNFMTSDRRKQLLRWGRKTFPVIIKKLSGNDVDFSKIMPDFEHALRLDDTRR